jgi:hypothetical protein
MHSLMGHREVPHAEGGLPMWVWMALFNRCFNYTQQGPQWAAWPDGGSLLEQPALTVSIFDIIESEVSKDLVRRMKDIKRGTD